MDILKSLMAETFAMSSIPYSDIPYLNLDKLSDAQLECFIKKNVQYVNKKRYLQYTYTATMTTQAIPQETVHSIPQTFPR